MESEEKVLEVELKMIQKRYNKVSNTIDTITDLTVENKQLMLQMKERKAYMTESIKLYDDRLSDRDEKNHKLNKSNKDLSINNDQLSKNLRLAKERLELATEEIQKLEAWKSIQIYNTKEKEGNIRLECIKAKTERKKI
eukprot:14106838-Ditylum_brightwellii.AAC.1